MDQMSVWQIVLFAVFSVLFVISFCRCARITDKALGKNLKIRDRAWIVFIAFCTMASFMSAFLTAAKGQYTFSIIFYFLTLVFMKFYHALNDKFTKD